MINIMSLSMVNLKIIIMHNKGDNMILHVIRKIKSEFRNYIYSYTYIFIGIFVLFMIIMSRSISQKNIESKVLFYDQTIQINETNGTPYMPMGFSLSKDKIKLLIEQFQFVSIMQNSFSIIPHGPSRIKVNIVSPSFIETGVVNLNIVNLRSEVEKVDLLYGTKWDDNCKEAVTIIDADSAQMLFGHVNVVGEILETNYGKLRIIGVVSNTSERQQMINNAIASGEPFSEKDFPSHCYIPHKYYATLGLSAQNLFCLVRDDRQSVDQTKLKIKEILNIPLEEKTAVISREDVVNSQLLDKNLFFQIIVSITSVFIFLGIINLISVNLYFYKINKNNIGIYKSVGFNNSKIIQIFFIENLIKSLLCTIASTFISFVVLFIICLFTKQIAFINFGYLFLLSLSLVAITTFICIIFNTIITVLTVRKPVTYFLRGE